MDAAFVEGVLNVQDWILALQAGVDIYREPLFAIAHRLALLGFVVAGLRIVTAGGSELRGAIMGVLAAALMLALAPAINGTAIATWDSLRVFASEQLVADFRAANTQLVKIGSASESLMFNGIVMTSEPEVQAAGQGEQVTGSESMNELSGRVELFTELTTLALIIVVLFMFLILVLTGLAITVAGIILPLGAGLLAFPQGTGLQLLSAYARVVISSLLLVMLFPVAFQVVFQFTAVQPLTTLATGLEENRAAFEGVVAGIGNDTTELGVIEGIETQLATNLQQRDAIRRNRANHVSGSGWDLIPWDLRPLTDGASRQIATLETQYNTLKERRDALKMGWLEKVSARVIAEITRLVNDLGTILLMIGLLVLGVFASVIALLRLEGYVGALVGGFVVGASSAVAGAALGAAALASRAKLPKGSPPKEKPGAPLVDGTWCIPYTFERSHPQPALGNAPGRLPDGGATPQLQSPRPLELGRPKPELPRPRE